MNNEPSAPPDLIWESTKVEVITLKLPQGDVVSLRVTPGVKQVTHRPGQRPAVTDAAAPTLLLPLYAAADLIDQMQRLLRSLDESAADPGQASH